MMKRYFKDVLLAICLAGLAYLFFFNADKNKIGYVNIHEVFDSFDMKKELQQKYNQVMGSKKRELDSLGMIIGQMDSVLSVQEEPSESFTQVYIRNKQKYSQIAESYEQEDLAIKQEYDKQIILRMNQYIKQFGDENNFDLFMGNTGNGVVMQAREELNYTKAVIQYINQKYAGK